MVAFVAASLPQYPFMFCGDRVHSSPTVPFGTSTPLSGSTSLISTHGYGLPHERSSAGR